MLNLDNPQWRLLNHAYGLATDTPSLLLQLSQAPHSPMNSEPWASLWSSLAHQGDVYEATFAALPHIVKIALKNISTIDGSYFQFVAWIEICRVAKHVIIPDDLEKPYFDALSQVPSLVAMCSKRDWSADFMQSALSAIAASKGQILLAEAILELTPDISVEFMGWFFDR